LTEPLRCAIREQVDDTLAFVINQDRSVLLALVDRPVVDTKHAGRGTGRERALASKGQEQVNAARKTKERTEDGAN
jgi:hypothetical protein